MKRAIFDNIAYGLKVRPRKIRAREAANTWKSIPPVFGSMYILLLQKFSWLGKNQVLPNYVDGVQVFYHVPSEVKLNQTDKTKGHCAPLSHSASISASASQVVNSVWLGMRPEQTNFSFITSPGVERIG